jgi:hypothetical protein
MTAWMGTRIWAITPRGLNCSRHCQKVRCKVMDYGAEIMRRRSEFWFSATCTVVDLAGLDLGSFSTESCYFESQTIRGSHGDWKFYLLTALAVAFESPSCTFLLSRFGISWRTLHQSNGSPLLAYFQGQVIKILPLSTDPAFASSLERLKTGACCMIKYHVINELGLALLLPTSGTDSELPLLTILYTVWENSKYFSDSWSLHKPITGSLVANQCPVRLAAYIETRHQQTRISSFPNIPQFHQETISFNLTTPSLQEVQS